MFTRNLVHSMAWRPLCPLHVHKDNLEDFKFAPSKVKHAQLHTQKAELNGPFPAIITVICCMLRVYFWSVTTKVSNFIVTDW